MANPVTRRLRTELKLLYTQPVQGIAASVIDDSDITKWTATIVGPADTPYEGLVYRLLIQFPDNYPIAPPKITFVTPMYHPNIDFSGRICLDILNPREKWSSALTVQSILLSLASLLNEPNNESPLNGQAAELWGVDMVLFKQHVLERYEKDGDNDLYGR